MIELATLQRCANGRTANAFLAYLKRRNFSDTESASFAKHAQTLNGAFHVSCEPKIMSDHDMPSPKLTADDVLDELFAAQTTQLFIEAQADESICTEVLK
jgi:hypothetical protein